VDEIYNETLTDEQTPEVNVSAMIIAVDEIVDLCKQREPTKKYTIHARIVAVLKEVDEGRFWPPLVDIFKACYEPLATRRKGRALVTARDRLIRQASIERKTFDGMPLEELTMHIAQEPFSAYGLFRFYTSSPLYIDFNCDDKECVFRACLSVHDTTVDDHYLYRTLVFEKVWNIAQEDDNYSSKKRKLVSAT